MQNRFADEDVVIGPWNETILTPRKSRKSGHKKLVKGKRKVHRGRFGA